eukprot:gnl/MRDRNA2_/MRDRNA2_56161_c0_seq1.p1 gnl/MRDRNA2_/MRDRNA2_56161_c0~~gnl/MRDRNA2_/MRDRNA2_56161_c0_seq1.p1  ORF type:complete len:787 (-),score=168.81 gnl/MRDRNA2_/MRDRNA2_56161_c0_seq1:79-2439(-)
MQEQAGIPEFARLKFVILECELLDGMDASGSKTLRKMVNDLKKANCEVYFTGVDHEFAANLKGKGVIENEGNCWSTVDAALVNIQKKALSRAAIVQRGWLRLHPNFAAANVVNCAQESFEPFAQVILEAASRHGCIWKYCKVLQVKAGHVLFAPGDNDKPLCLINSGIIGYFKNLSKDGNKWSKASAVYRKGSFINREFLSFSACREYAVCVDAGEILYWDADIWWVVKREAPLMAAEITRAVLRQNDREVTRLAETCARLDAATTESNAAEDKDTFQTSEEELPGYEFLSQKLRHMELARVLGEFGLFEELEGECVYPRLPEPSRADFEESFKAYATVGNDGAKLSMSKVHDALQFAGCFGVFGAAAPNGNPTTTLTLSEFLDLGHKAIMSGLSKAKMSALERLFKDHCGGSDQMNKEQFKKLFFDTFKQRLMEDETDRLMDEWDLDRSGTIDHQEFLGIVSRLVKLHQSDWHLLCAIKDIKTADFSSGEKADLSTITLSVAQVVKAIEKNHVSLAGTSVEEMIWMADSESRNPVFPMPQEIKMLDILSEIYLNLTELFTAGHENKPLPPCGSEIVKGSKRHSVQVVAETKELAYELADQNSMIIDEGQGDKSVHIPDTWQAKLYLILEVPASSSTAFYWGMFVLFLVLVCILALVAETFESIEKGVGEQGWLVFEIIMTLIFTMEFFLRWLVCDSLGTMTKGQFFLKPMNICDFIACLPLYLELILGSSGVKSLRLLRMVRLVRLARFSRLAKYSGTNALIGPMAMVLTVIWGIYYKERLSDDK